MPEPGGAGEHLVTDGAGVARARVARAQVTEHVALVLVLAVWKRKWFIFKLFVSVKCFVKNVS